MTFFERLFDVFLTIDRKLERQNNLSVFLMGFVIAQVRSNVLDEYRPIFDDLMAAADRIKPGEVIHIRSTRSR